MIILFASQKGGSGKSTLAINAAAYLACQGKDVVLVDADKQPSSSRFVADRNENPDLPVIHSVAKRQNIRKTLLDLKERYDYVIVDVAGHDSPEMRTGMTGADMLVVPFIPSNMDLDTIDDMNTVINEAKDFNPDLKVVAVLNKVPSNPSIREEQEARDYLKDYPDLPVCRSIIRHRKVYRDILPYGLGAVESKNSKAKAEVQLLMQEILSWS
jgi:chromosome partitioning protein